LISEVELWVKNLISLICLEVRSMLILFIAFFLVKHYGCNRELSVQIIRVILKKSITTWILPIAPPRIPSTRAIEPIATSHNVNLKEMVSISSTPGRFWDTLEYVFFFGLRTISFYSWSNSNTSSLIEETFLCLSILFSDSF